MAQTRRMAWFVTLGAVVALLLGAVVAQESENPNLVRRQRDKAPKPQTRPKGKGKIDAAKFIERFVGSKGTWQLAKDFQVQGPRAVFKLLDADSDGLLDSTEMRGVVKYLQTAPKVEAAHKKHPEAAMEHKIPEAGLDRIIEEATKDGDQSPLQFELMAKRRAKAMGKDPSQLFQSLDMDKSGTLSADELKGYKSLLYTGKTHADRSGERKWPDHESRDPRKAPPRRRKGDKDLSFAEFDEMYRDQVTNEKQPHGHHKAFLACVRLERTSRLPRGWGLVCVLAVHRNLCTCSSSRAAQVGSE